MRNAAFCEFLWGVPSCVQINKQIIMCFFNLPTIFQKEILLNWIINSESLSNLVKFDSALCNKELRNIFLSFSQKAFFVLPYNLQINCASNVTHWIILRNFKMKGLQLRNYRLSLPKFFKSINVEQADTLTVEGESVEKSIVVNNTLGDLINRCNSLISCIFVNCFDKNNNLWGTVSEKSLFRIKVAIINDCSESFNFNTVQSIRTHCINLVEFQFYVSLFQNSMLLQESDFITIIDRNPSLEKFVAHHEFFSSAIIESFRKLKFLKHLKLILESSCPLPLQINLALIGGFITSNIMYLEIGVFQESKCIYDNSTKGKRVVLRNHPSDECESFFQKIGNIDHIELKVDYSNDNFDNVFDYIGENNFNTLKSMEIKSNLIIYSWHMLIPLLKIPSFGLIIHSCFERNFLGVIRSFGGIECFVNIFAETNYRSKHENLSLLALMRDNINPLSYYYLKKKIELLVGADFNEIDKCDVEEVLAEIKFDISYFLL